MTNNKLMEYFHLTKTAWDEFTEYVNSRPDAKMILRYIRSVNGDNRPLNQYRFTNDPMCASIRKAAQDWLKTFVDIEFLS